MENNLNIYIKKNILLYLLISAVIHLTAAIFITIINKSLILLSYFWFILGIWMMFISLRYLLFPYVKLYKDKIIINKIIFIYQEIINSKNINDYKEMKLSLLILCENKGIKICYNLISEKSKTILIDYLRDRKNKMLY